MHHCCMYRDPIINAIKQFMDTESSKSCHGLPAPEGERPHMRKRSRQYTQAVRPKYCYHNQLAKLLEDWEYVEETTNLTFVGGKAYEIK